MEFTDRPLEPFGEGLLDVAIPTQLSLKTPLIFRIVKALRDRGLIDEQERTPAELCFDESLVNAMVHGNQMDPRKKVRVSLFAGAEGWGAIIEDQGEGFKPEDLPSMDDPDFPMRESGRGIMLVESFVDTLLFNRKGNRMFISRGRRPAGGGGPAGAAAAHEPAPLGPPEPRGAAPGVPELSGPVAVSAAADALVITVAGPRLDEENSGTIRNAVNSSRLGNIILDLSRVTYMSSVGTGALVSARKASAQRRGRLILAGLQPAVLEVMKVMGLSSVFETAPDAELAARALKKP